MNPIEFTAHISARSVQFGKRMAFSKGRSFMYNDKKTSAYYQTVSDACLPFVPPEPILSGLAVELEFHLPRPIYLSKKKSPPEAIYAPRRPDCDNLAKGFLDPMTKLGFWKDDAQIVCLTIKKLVHTIGGEPFVKVKIQAVS